MTTTLICHSTDFNSTEVPPDYFSRVLLSAGSIPWTANFAAKKLRVINGDENKQIPGVFDQEPWTAEDPKSRGPTEALWHWLAILKKVS